MPRSIFLLFTLFLLLSHCAQAQDSDPLAAEKIAIPKKVLFIGNSYTYFWNLPQQMEVLLNSQQESSIQVRQSTAGGANLGQHWRGDRGLESRKKIQNGTFDAVVLQDQSLRAIQHPDSLLYFAELLHEEASKTDAKVYLYMTWAREWNPYMQEKITEEYTAVAEKIKATLVPVGPAWARARALRPELKLYDADGSHPSPLGSYLTACVFYGVFTRQSPVGLPHRVIDTDRRGDILYLNILAANDAAFCQQVAQEILRLN